MLVVTETPRAGDQFSCWLFPAGLTFYLLAMSDCNEAASQRLTGGLINPLATFREALPTTTSPETPAPYFKDAPLSEKEEKTNKAAGNVYITKTEKRESGAVEHNLRALSSGTVRCCVIDYLPAFLLLPSLILFVT